MSWRDFIPVHPAADLFPLLGDAELLELGQDIRRNGLTSPIAIKVECDKGRGCDTWGRPLFENPVLVDGRNRLDAMESVGLRVSLVKDNIWKVLAEERVDGEWCNVNLNHIDATIIEYANVLVITGDPVEYIISADLMRRNLTGDQNRELIGKLLKLDPSKSNRQIAAIVGADHKTVGAVRKEAEATGEIPQLLKTTGKDGKQRTKPKPKSVNKKALAPKEERRIGPSPLLMRCQLAIEHEIKKVINELAADEQSILSARLHDLITDLLGEPAATIDPPTETNAKAQATPPAPHDGVMPDIPAYLDRRQKPSPTTGWNNGPGDDETSVYVGRDAEWDVACDRLAAKAEAEG